MTDTVRSLTALTALLADNTTGAISPQDLRDVLVSLQPAVGSYYISTPAASTIAVQGVQVKAAGTTTAVILGSGRWTMPADNRLVYAGVDARVNVTCSASVSVAGTSQEISLGIAKNGTPLAHSVITDKIDTSGDGHAASLAADFTVTAGDSIELWVGNNSGTAAPTVTKAYLTAVAVVI